MESRNEEKKICRPTMTRVAAVTASRSSDSSPKPRSIQVMTIHAASDEAREQDRAAEQQAVLEAVARAHAVEPRVLLAHEVRPVGVRAQAERDDLRADDAQQLPAIDRVQLPLAPEERDLQQRDQRDDRAEQRASRRRG